MHKKQIHLQYDKLNDLVDLYSLIWNLLALTELIRQGWRKDSKIGEGGAQMFVATAHNHLGCLAAVAPGILEFQTL